MSFNLPSGAPYVVSADANLTNYTYSNVRLTWSDGSVWGFSPSVGDPNLALLTSITAATATSAAPQTILLNWAGSANVVGYRIISIVNQSDNKTLLGVTYSGNDTDGYVLTQVADCYGRKIVYGNSVLMDTSVTPAVPVTPTVNILATVSQVGPTTGGTPAYRYRYAYLNFEGYPLLRSITTPDPDDAALAATARIEYDTQGKVAHLSDGNGNKTVFTYGEGQTKVEKLNSAGVLETFHTAKFDSEGRDIGTIDAENNHTYIQYSDGYNPHEPTQITDASGRQTYITYEPNAYGLVNTVTSPRGIVTDYDYAYNAWPFGLLTKVQESKPSASLTRPATTITYVSGRERAGLVQSVTAPHPSSQTVDGTDFVPTQTSFTYNDFGDVTTTTAPSHNGLSSLVTLYNYTTDGTYTQPARKGQPVRVVDPLSKATGLRYDQRGNVISTRDASGNVTLAAYNLADQVTTAQNPATGQTGTGQSRTDYIYTYVGGPLKTTNLYDESNSATPFRSVSTAYGREGEVLGVSGATETINPTYTSFYALKTFSDAQGNQTVNEYNLRGLPTRIRKPGHNLTSGYDVQTIDGYNAEGQVTQSTDGRGIVTNYTYSPLDGQLTDINYTYPSSLPAPSQSEDVKLYYDDWGRLMSRTDASGSESYTYSASDSLLSIATTYKRADNSSLPPLNRNYFYFPNGLRQSLRGGTGSANGKVYLNYYYNRRGQLTQVNDGFGSSPIVATSTYFDNGWLASQVNGNGWQRSFTPNALGQTISLAQSIPAQGAASPGLNYGGTGTNALRYDGAGNMVTETAPWQNVPTSATSGTGTTTYTYDSNDRLTGENSTRWNGYTRGYGYDASYNRTSRTGSSTGSPSFADTLTVPNRNRFSAVSQSRSDGTSSNQDHTYDGEGNRTSVVTTTSAGVTTTTRYGFDSENRLNHVTQQVGSGAQETTFRAGYRADGLRAWKESYPGGVAKRTYFLYDGDTVIGEVDGAGVVRVISTWGADGLLMRRHYPATGTGYVRHYLWDLRGNIAAVTDETGTILSTPSSDGFSSSSTDEPVATFGGQVGGYRDAETGLILFQNRYYDSNTGTWLTRDPIGEAGGINLYSYVQGNPVNLVDPDGLAPSRRSEYDPGIAGEWTKQQQAAYYWGENFRRICEDERAHDMMMGAITGSAGGGGGGKMTGAIFRLFRKAGARFKAASKQTTAARALSKHADLLGLTQKQFFEVFPTPKLQNEAAGRLIRNILDNGKRIDRHHASRGDIIEYRLPDGTGARWLKSGKFDTFLGKYNPALHQAKNANTP